jgi:hypothetical protein
MMIKLENLTRYNVGDDVAGLLLPQLVDVVVRGAVEVGVRRNVGQTPHTLGMST